jgi:regulator of protease activity HflC (stomatin/prohibitin superfamily)
MTDHQLSPFTARIRPPANVKISQKLLVVLFGLAILVALAASSFVIVEPTEMAGKRRLGQVVVNQPLRPGLHFKLPLIESIDTLQTSLETYKLDKLTVNTVDNQPITLAVGLTYRIPPSAVLKLLYEVGRAGNLDIAENFQRIIADRTAKVFAQQNTTTISENRERLSTALKTLLSADLGRLYGVDVVDFQIAGITYSESFVPRSRRRLRLKTKPLPRRTPSTVSGSRHSRRWRGRMAKPKPNSESPMPTARPRS